MHSVMRKNLLPQSWTIQEQNSLWVIVTLSLSLWLQRLRAATNSSGQEPSAVWFRASNNTLRRRRKVLPTHRHRNHILFSQKFDSRDHLVLWLLSSSWKQINNSCLCSSRLLLLQSAEIGLDKSTQ
jgi:hypothetical protein